MRYLRVEVELEDTINETEIELFNVILAAIRQLDYHVYEMAVSHYDESTQTITDEQTADSTPDDTV